MTLWSLCLVGAFAQLVQEVGYRQDRWWKARASVQPSGSRKDCGVFGELPKPS